jgi:hypothetical protein
MSQPSGTPSPFASMANWKTFFSACLGIAALVLSFWIFRADLASHSLAARLTSSVALQVAATSALSDVQVSIGGQVVVSPFLSTIVLTNDGLRPIVASDFESPLELSTNEGAEIVRATVSAVDPLDIKAVIVLEKQAVKLKPILLNPGDSLQFAIITMGKPPIFTPRARIAGVPKIWLEDDTKKKISLKTASMNFVMCSLSIIMTPIFLIAMLRPYSIRSIRSVASGGILLSATLAAISSYKVFEWLGIERTPLLFTGIEILCAVPIIAYLSFRTPRPATV